MTIICLTLSGEKLDTRKKNNIRLSPNETENIHLHEKRVQYFERYRIILSSGSTKKVYLGHVLNQKPDLEPEGPAKGVWDVRLLGYEDYYQKRGSVAHLKIRVKNYGELESKGTKAKIEFIDRKKKVIKKITKDLGNGTVKDWAEKTYTFKIYKVRSYESIRVTVSTDPPPGAGNMGFAPVEFSEKKEVETANFKFDYKNGDLHIYGEVRNGTSKTVINTVVTFSFIGADGKVAFSKPVTVTERIEPGQKVSYNAVIKKAKQFVSYEYSLAFKNAD
jgi:hypothetical protein